MGFRSRYEEFLGNRCAAIEGWEWEVKGKKYDKYRKQKVVRILKKKEVRKKGVEYSKSVLALDIITFFW